MGKRSDFLTGIGEVWNGVEVWAKSILTTTPLFSGGVGCGVASAPSPGEEELPNRDCRG